jgi:molybdate transport system substrate-binding protein
MAPTITGISSMATRRVLAELAAGYTEATGRPVSIEAVGGVDAARRVRAGEAFDLVILAADVLEKLEAEGRLIAGSRVEFVRSPMAMAVRAGAPRPEIASELAAKAAALGARSIGYSTGPSGAHLIEVLKSWGVDPAGAAPRLVQAQPGVPVAALVARGEAEIGVQQLSELLGEPGIEIVGPPPPPLHSVTTFCIGIGARSGHVEEARAVIAYLNAREADETKRRCGMEP